MRTMLIQVKQVKQPESKPLINISSYYYSESGDKQKLGQGYVRAHT